MAGKQGERGFDENRIRRFEAILNEAEQVLSDYETALDRFFAIQKKLGELNDYYGSEDWWADLRASEAGLLPDGIPHGVLSEDGVWNLLERSRELRKESKKLL